MFNRIILYLKNFDWIMFASIILLVCFGLAEIYSVALGRGGANLINFHKQIFFVGVGIIFLFTFAFFDYNNWRSFSNSLYIFGAVILVLVLFLGAEARGTRGWFNFGQFSFQPVELVKFILIIFLARYFSNVSLKINPFKHLIISGAGVLIFFILVILQPDFGSALILFLLWLVMIAVAGVRKKYFFIIALAVAVIGAAGWAFYLKPYQKERVMTFLNPSFNPLEQGYNVSQAIIAVGAGGLTGKGIGFGSQSQLKFLPESQNDFIFAVIAEELGFLGSGLVLLFFAVFFYRCLVNLRKINNDFGIFFILGAAGLIFIEMFINISMNIGILPVVGISLPFLSYGGSSMLVNLMLVGVIESIVVRSKIK